MGDSLPVLQRPIDNTAMSAYMSCPREYFYSMILHRRSKGTSAALAYGKVWHRLMDAHYRSGGNAAIVRMTLDKWWEVDGHSNEGDHRTKERAWLDYLGYVKRWGADPSKEQGKTVGFPDNPLIELSVNAQGGRLNYPYAGKIDRIIEIGGMYYAEDHKTTSRLDKNFSTKFETDNQMKGYVHQAQLLFPGMKIVGARINVLHILSKASNYERFTVTFTPDIIREWADNTNVWSERIATATDNFHALVASGVSEHDAAQANFPGHFGTNGCDRKYGLCQYHTVCAASPRVRQRLLELEFDVNPWNPLEVEDAD